MFSTKHTHQPMKASFYLQDFIELPQWVIAAPINQHILSDKSFVRPVRDDLQNNVWKRRWTFKWVKDKSKLRWQWRCHGNETLKALMQVWRRRFLSECFYCRLPCGCFFFFLTWQTKKPDEPHKLSILEVNWKFLRKKLRHLPENVFKLG